MELYIAFRYIWEYKSTKPEKFTSISQAPVNRSHQTFDYVILIVTAASCRTMTNFKPHKAISNGKIIFQIDLRESI